MKTLIDFISTNFKLLYRYFKENIPARVIALLWMVMLASVAPLMFKSDAMNLNKVVVFLLIDKVRYPENIAYDLSEWFNMTTLFYCIYILLPIKKYKDYAKPFLIISLLGLPAYFLFYSQYVTAVTIPLIFVWQIRKIRRYHVEKGNNNRSSGGYNINS